MNIKYHPEVVKFIKEQAVTVGRQYVFNKIWKETDTDGVLEERTASATLLDLSPFEKDDPSDFVVRIENNAFYEKWLNSDQEAQVSDTTGG